MGEIFDVTSRSATCHLCHKKFSSSSGSMSMHGHMNSKEHQRRYKNYIAGIAEPEKTSKSNQQKLTTYFADSTRYPKKSIEVSK